MNAAAICVRQERCAKVRNRNVECLKCAQACTSGCISLVDDELVIDSSKCVGCGTCATVCPTCALESRHPSDAELLLECMAAAASGECVVACEPLAKSGKLEGLDYAQVKCLGRVDESLLCSLVSKGVDSIRLACGPCDRCKQRLGAETAELVLDTTRDLLDSFGKTANLAIAKMDLEGDCACEPLAGDSLEGGLGVEGKSNAAPVLPRVMKDGTLPHFLPDRRERLLDALSTMGSGEPSRPLSNRLWGCVVIDGMKCTSCRMCATFCPTGAISKFDEKDGTFGVLHFPGDCVKCASCRDVCPEGAIILLDEVKPRYLMGGETHRYVMKKRPVEIDNPQQILNTMRTLIPGNLYER